MESRLLLLSLLCLSLNNVYLLQPSEASAEVDPKLIASACDHCTAGQMCVTWLQDNENDQELMGIDKSDTRKIEKEAVTVSEAVEMKTIQWRASSDPAEVAAVHSNGDWPDKAVRINSYHHRSPEAAREDCGMLQRRLQSGRQNSVWILQEGSGDVPSSLVLYSVSTTFLRLSIDVLHSFLF
nr:uncharacterized protein LOC109160208 [Ipomoea batatas]